MKKLKLNKILKELRNKEWDMPFPTGQDPRFDPMSKDMGFRKAMQPPMPKGHMPASMGHPEFQDELGEPDEFDLDDYYSAYGSNKPTMPPKGMMKGESEQFPSGDPEYPDVKKESDQYPSGDPEYPDVKKEAEQFPSGDPEYPDVKRKKKGVSLESLFIKEGATEQQMPMFKVLNILRSLCREILGHIQAGDIKTAVHKLKHIVQSIDEMNIPGDKGSFVKNFSFESKELSLESLFIEDFGGAETERATPDLSGDLSQLVSKTKLAAQHAERLMRMGKEDKAKELLGRLHQLLMSKLG